MSPPNEPGIRNRLLGKLSGDAFGVLKPHLEAVTLELRQVLCGPDEPISHVYFPDSGIASVVLSTRHESGIEIGLVGREGFVGTSVALGVGRSPHKAFIQGPGKGWRLPADVFAQALDDNVELRRLILAYIHAHLVQLASTAHSNADFTVEERLARWILMCQDRTDGNDLSMTHEFMALMLGVRRPGVTVATHVLEGERLIRARRGVITVLDREGLKKLADGSYGTAEAEYDRVIEASPSTDSNLVHFPSGAAATRPGPE